MLPVFESLKVGELLLNCQQP